MTTTMDGMAEVVRILDREKIRDRVKIGGGAPVYQGFANRIGAGGYASRAPAAVAPAKRLVSEKAI